MKVKAAPGLAVPREGSREKITDATAVDVPDTSYYRRRLANGELLKVEQQAPQAEAPPPETTEGSDKQTAKKGAKS